MNFKSLIDENKYQVFLLSSPLPFPLQFARHPWFVINKKGILSRWEVWQYAGLSDQSWGHLYRDLFPLFQGIHMSRFSMNSRWKPAIVASFEGDAALKMINVIEHSPEKYPHHFERHYILTGPNSNTYAQWVINHVPETHVTLSWRHIGKNFIPRKR